jgi:pimeloyl-ACP methyl ester carboxylesterase
LVDDIVAVLDALELCAVVLVGHSFAVFEMAQFGIDHADRCLGLVYLDAAYDYNDPALFRIYQKTPDPSAPPMNAADSASVEGVQAWYERTQGYPPATSEILAGSLFDADGRFLGRKHPTSTQRKFMRMEKPSPDWGAISCPSLGLYGIPGPLGDWLPYYQQLEPLERERADEWQRAYNQWASGQMGEFAEAPQNMAVEYNGAHIFFLRLAEEVAREIREFVSRLQ